MKIKLSVLCFIFCTAWLLGDTHELTNTEGKTISVVLIDCQDEVVDCRFPSKNDVMKVPMEKLDEESQQLVKDWVAKGGNLSRKLSIDSHSMFKGDNKRDVTDGTKIKTYSVTPKLKIRNKDNNHASVAGKVVVFLYPKPDAEIASSDAEGEDRQEFDLPSIPANKTIELEGTSIVYTTSEKATKSKGNKSNNTNAGSIELGSDYKGYAFYILDNERKVILEKASNDSVLEEYRDLATEPVEKPAPKKKK